jgi:Fe2+ or Zn2+ uptake regulation protein
MIAIRETKYTKQLMQAMSLLGHASNGQLLATLQATYPELSATTVHRITARLCERGELATAPVDQHGAMRFDSTTSPHDHFLCSGCGGMRDIDIAERVLPTLSAALGGCKVTGRLVIHGTCQSCMSKNNKEML